MEYNTERFVRKKITWISIFFCFLVVFAHGINLESYGIDRYSEGLAHFVFYVEFYEKLLAQVAIPTFFFISGLLFFRNFKIGDLWRKWKNRLCTIVIPFFLWCTLYYLYSVCYTNLPILQNAINSQHVAFSLEGWGASLWSNSYYTLWFLKALIVLILLAPLEWVLLRNHIEGVPTGLIIIVVLWIQQYKALVPIQLPGGMPFYAVGAYLGLNHNSLLNKRSKWLSRLSVPFLFAHIFTRLYYMNNIAILFFIIAIWFCLDYVPNGTRTFRWMENTFFYYVAHDMLLEALKKVWLLLFGRSAGVALGGFIMAPGLTIIIMVGFSTLLRNKTPIIWKGLTGR